MLYGNYNKILEKIAKSSGLEKEEIERRIAAKKAKLSGLISNEGAAQIVAAELGISFDNEKLKIDELLPGMKKVQVVGKIINLFPVREFNKNGRQGKVANFVIADEHSNVRVVLWDVNHIELLEKGKINQGDIIEISNATMRETELHLGSFSELKISNEILENIQTEMIARQKNIIDFRQSRDIKTRAFIVQIFNPRSFEICPQCNKRGIQEGENYNCAEHGKVIPEKRYLINIVIDDGTETIRAVLFHETISELGLNDLENNELLEKQKQELLGKEMFFSGDVRQNKLFNNMEFVVNNVQEINLDELVKELEKS